MCVCIYIYRCVCVCVCVCVCSCVYLHMCLYVYINVYIWVCIYVSKCIYAWMYVCVCIYVCGGDVYICIYLCGCFSVSYQASSAWKHSVFLIQDEKGPIFFQVMKDKRKDCLASFSINLSISCKWTRFGCGELSISLRFKSKCQLHNIQHNLNKQT